MRNPDDRELAPRVGSFGGGDRLAIVLFEQQSDVELVLRVIELGKASDETRDDGRLPIGGHEDRIHRQLLVGDRPSFLFRDIHHLGMPEREPERPQAIYECGEIGESDQGDQCDGRRERGNEGADTDDGRDRKGNGELSRGGSLLRRKVLRESRSVGAILGATGEGGHCWVPGSGV